MILRVYRYGDKILREKATPIEAITDSLKQLADDMLETMYSFKGVGLAAEQIGRLEKMCVIDVPSDCETEEDAQFNSMISMPLKLFNPEIIAKEGTETDKEGCLSFPKVGGSVERAAQVTCRYLDENGVEQTITARGYLARVVQHELDHLDGVLYIDRMSTVEKLKYAPKLRKLAKQNGGVR